MRFEINFSRSSYLILSARVPYFEMFLENVKIINMTFFSVDVRQQHVDGQLRDVDGVAEPEDVRLEAVAHRQRRDQSHGGNSGSILSGLCEVQVSLAIYGGYVPIKFSTVHTLKSS
jgi:hypothetical protein